MATTHSNVRDPRTKDETGKVYGKLTVIGYAGKSLKTHGGAYWHCRCECGNEVTVVGVTLRSGKTRSCSSGCGHKTHGMKDAHEYFCWRDMKSRCYNPANPQFANYGGRGIAVCKSWLESFDSFLADMGPKPFSGASIGRIDNDAGYSPGNCRWETQEQQHNNKRTCRYLTYGGITLTTAQWARRTGMAASTLWGRLDRGWSVAKALTTPTRTRIAT